MKSLLILLLFSGLSLGEGFDLIQISNFSDKEVIERVSERLNKLSDEEKLALVKKIYQKKRAALFLDLMKIRKLPTNVIFAEAPQSHFKYQMTLDILESDHLWSTPMVAGASGVGSLYQQSWTLCHSVIDTFFQDEKIDWNGPLTRERRIGIAKKFEDLLIEKEGFISSKKETREGTPIERRIEGNRDKLRDRSLPQKVDNSKTTNQTAPEKSSLPWIIAGVLFVGILALLFKTFKGKSTS